MFQELVVEVQAAGATVFLSSHILPEVERVADRVGIVRKGRLIAVDTVEAFKAQAHRSVVLQFNDPVDPHVFSSIDNVTEVDVRNEGTVLALAVMGDMDAVIKAAGSHDAVSVSTRSGELEEVFLSYYAGTEDAP